MPDTTEQANLRRISTFSGNVKSENSCSGQAGLDGNDIFRQKRQDAGLSVVCYLLFCIRALPEPFVEIYDF